MYYRQETWGGEGAQPFKVGDFLVADVVTRLDNGEWPEGVHERDMLIMDEKFAWKRLRHSEGGHRITRTMTDSVFSRTYRSLETGMPPVAVWPGPVVSGSGAQELSP